VATHGTYSEPGPVSAVGTLSEKYFLMMPAQVNADGIRLSWTQGAALFLGLAVLSLVLTVRLVDAEAGAKRVGLFLYLFLAVMVIALFVAVLMLSDNRILGVLS